MKIFRIPLAVALVVVAGRALNAGAQTETNLHLFVGTPFDGAHPYAALFQDSDGNFYSTTLYGGTNSCNCGTVFRINPGGSFTTLYSFAGAPNDGAEPWSALIRGSDGNFYATTTEGGTRNSGTVFRISPSGSYTNVHSFAGAPTDGADPWAALVQGSDGNLYGTSAFGGTSNSGTVFRISPSGSYTNLYSFGSHRNDGSAPYGGLALGSDGNFYGTASGGGTSDNGAVFRISPGGSETNLYSFAGAPNDGAGPYAALVQGSDGNFYGTTAFGGHGIGTVFRINPSGSETNLYSISGFPNGAYAGLMQGSDGNFYGVTIGSVFRITPAGAFTTLFSLTTSNGGFEYSNVLVQGADGNFYGTTGEGDTSPNCYNGCGTVFRFTVPLNPPPCPINQIAGVQVSGTNVVFNIPSIEGEVYQLQFSSSLAPTNWVNVPGVLVTNSIGGILTLTNFVGAVGPQGFYRFAITP